MGRGALVLSALVWLALAGCGRAAQPNILLIVIDTARADHFSINGYARDTSPAIAALGREGAVYTNAYTPSPWTLPAHASLFTGLFPSAHGADAGHLRLDDDLPFLAERLRDAGYRTVGYTENPWIGKKYNFHVGFDTYEEIWRNIQGTEGDMGAAMVAVRVDRWLTWRAGHPQARGQPFFLFINYFEPHLPYNPPEPDRERFLSPPVDRQAVDRLRRFKHPEEVKQILGAGELAEDDFRVLSDLYDGEIAYVDRRIGEIVERLRRDGLLDTTFVVVTSDHGEMLGEHGLMDHKLSVHEPLLRIPMVVRYPSRIRAGQRVEEIVMLQDLYPTILAVAGSSEDGPDARALPGVRIEEGPGRRGRAPAWGATAPLIAEYARPTEFLEVMRGVVPNVDITPWDRALIAYRRGVEKLHWASDGRHRLFDILEDPGEIHDLATSRPDRVAALAGEVDRWLRRPGVRPPIGLPADP